VPAVCPFEVMLISDVTELSFGLICLVSAVKIDLRLIDGKSFVTKPNTSIILTQLKISGITEY